MIKLISIAILLVLCFTATSQIEVSINSCEQKQIGEIELANLQNEKYLEAIRIYVSNYQIVELLQNRDLSYDGKLINYVTKVRRNERPIKIITEVIEITPNDVKYLMDSLFQLNIQHLKDGSNVEGYSIGFDGKTYGFECKKDSNITMVNYWEPENERYQNSQLYEVQQVRAILSVIRRKVSLYPLFRNFQFKLGNGRYAFGGVIMTKG